MKTKLLRRLRRKAKRKVYPELNPDPLTMGCSHRWQVHSPFPETKYGRTSYLTKEHTLPEVIFIRRRYILRMLSYERRKHIKYRLRNEFCRNFFNNHILNFSRWIIDNINLFINITKKRR